MTNYVPVEVFPGVIFNVYADGRIESTPRKMPRKNGRMDNRAGKFLRPSIDRYGYERVILTSNGIRKTCLVHRLVAEAFIDNPEDLPTVNHIDGDKRNNCVDNLEWASHASQKAHAIRTGLCSANVEALQAANRRRSIPVFYRGNLYPSIREASRVLGIDSKKIRREGKLV